MDDFVHIESPTKAAFSTTTEPFIEQGNTKPSLANEPNQLAVEKESSKAVEGSRETSTEREDSAANIDIEWRPSALQVDLHFLDSHPFVRQTVVDKVHGCLIGSALGDTIGLYTEFLPKKLCTQHYGREKFSLVEPRTEFYPDSHRIRFEPCAWTDDTDQALLIILAYLHRQTSSRKADPLQFLAQDFAGRLRIWISQGLLALARPPCGIGNLVGSVVASAGYLDDPTGGATQRWVKSNRHLAPNGSLMRTHPVGIIGLGMSEEHCWRLASSVGMTTHADPRCTVACCISVGLVRGIIRGEILGEDDVNATIERAYYWVRAQPDLMNPGNDPDITGWEISRHLDREEFDKHVYAKTYSELNLDNTREMGYVYKCLGSAVLALRLCLRATKETFLPSQKSLFEHIITELIMEGGDSDTNGAAAAALVGAHLGYANLPAHWTEGLAHKTWLIVKIDRLLKLVGILECETWPMSDEQPQGPEGLMTEKQLERRDQLMLVGIMEKRKEQESKEKNSKDQEKMKRLVGWFSKDW